MTETLADYNPQATTNNSEDLDGMDTTRNTSKHSSNNYNNNIIYMLHRIYAHYVNHANTHSSIPITERTLQKQDSKRSKVGQYQNLPQIPREGNQ